MMIVAKIKVSKKVMKGNYKSKIIQQIRDKDIEESDNGIVSLPAKHHS
jgi:hypothetical protein